MKWSMNQALNVVERMKGGERLVGELMLTTGAKLSSLLAVRIGDLDPMLRQISVVDDGMKKSLPLLDDLQADVRCQMGRMRLCYEGDVRRAGLTGWGRLARGWRWQDMPLFGDETLPARLFIGQGLRPAFSAVAFVTALSRAAIAASFHDPVHSHTLRHVHAQWRLEQGDTVSGLGHHLGHHDVMTTLLYAQSLSRGGLAYT